ncbi:MAG: hypothetical protein J5I53_10080 [Bradyrhizobiaceae bacterium]|nr:hypothetical protein [Bradyrhizobiaceae bacterium]
MSDSNFIQPTPEEALHAFMDGELLISDEQALFNELAADPSLRSEMRDMLSIRSAVIHDIVAPPAAAEEGLMAAVGFSSTGAAVGAGAVAASSPWWTVLFSAVSLCFGFALAWLLLTRTGLPEHGQTDLARNSASLNNASPGGVAGHPQLNVTVHAPIDTVYRTTYVATARKQQSPVEPPSSFVPSPTTPSAVESTTVPTDVVDVEMPSIITHASVQALGALNATSQATTSVPSLLSPISPSFTSQTPGYIRIRTLASGVSSKEELPSSIQQALLPNTAFALVFPLTSQHRVGVELGTESFHQEFMRTDPEGRNIQVSQTPVLFWMGGTYEYRGNDFAFASGVSPFAIATFGYAYSQGPVGRATVGLAYQPFGPLRVFLGLDASSLAFQQQSSWFTSNKWGLSYGLSLDIDGIK